MLFGFVWLLQNIWVTNDYGYVPVDITTFPSPFFIMTLLISIGKTGYAANGTGTANPSKAPEITSAFRWDL